METDALPPRVRQAQFGSTCWTTVKACAGTDDTATLARQELCQDYWYPLYAHVVRLGYPSQDAVDLTQEFFADILRRPWFERPDHLQGRFRTFLLSSLTHFLRDQRDRQRAGKRAGSYSHVALESCGADGIPISDRLAAVPSEEIYEMDWVAIIVKASLRRLETEYAADGKLERYQLLKPFLSVEGEGDRYEATARQMQTSVANVKTSVHRLRKHYGSILREEVQRTVYHADDVQNEMLYLRKAFAAMQA